MYTQFVYIFTLLTIKIDGDASILGDEHGPGANTSNGLR